MSTFHLQLAPESRPLNRAQCPDERPCPWVSCAHHLAHDEIKRMVRYKSDDDAIVDEIGAMSETCAIDAEDEGRTLDEIGAALGLTRERVRQIQEIALRELRFAPGALRDWSHDLRGGMAVQGPTDEREDD